MRKNQIGSKFTSFFEKLRIVVSQGVFITLRQEIRNRVESPVTQTVRTRLVMIPYNIKNKTI